eukprot:204465_1
MKRTFRSMDYVSDIPAKRSKSEHASNQNHSNDIHANFNKMRCRYRFIHHNAAPNIPSQCGATNSTIANTTNIGIVYGKTPRVCHHFGQDILINVSNLLTKLQL